MAKVLCVLYDDPVDGHPKSYPIDAIPKIERYPGGQTAPSPKAIDFTPGELLGSVSGELGLRKFLESNGHTLFVTSDKDGKDSVLEQHLHDVDVIISEHVHHSVRQLRVELGSDHSRALRRPAAQPSRTNTAAGTAFRDCSSPGGCQRGEKSASLGSGGLHIAALQRHSECPDHKLGQVGRSAHFNSLPAMQTAINSSTM